MTSKPELIPQITTAANSMLNC